MTFGDSKDGGIQRGGDGAQWATGAWTQRAARCRVSVGGSGEGV